MKSTKVILLLTGIAIGAVAGILLAPEEGKKTRDKWAKKAKKYKKDFADKTEELKEKAKEYKDKANDIKDNIEGAVKDVKKRFG